MDKNYKYSVNSNNVGVLSVQDCTDKKTKREEFRITAQLKGLVKAECEIKNMTATEFYTNLAIWYFSKVGKVEGYQKKKLIYGVDWEL